MSSKAIRRLCNILLAAFVLLFARQATPQNWASKSMPNYLANGQIGIAAINGRLILTWGDQKTNALTTIRSTDGVNWSTPEAFTSFPLVYSVTDVTAPPPYESGGVSMTSCPSCGNGTGYVYVAYLDPTGNKIYAAGSSDGVNWDGGYLLTSTSSPPGWASPGTSTPALYGAYTNNTVGFAFPVYSGTANQPEGPDGSDPTIGYTIQMGEFPYNFSSPATVYPLPTSTTANATNCFFWDKTTGQCQNSRLSPQYPVSNPNVIMEFDEGLTDYDAGIVDSGPTGPWTPLWTGGDGVELRASAQGNPLLDNAEPPIFYTVNQGSLGCVGITSCPPSDYYNDAAQWSNAGVGGAVDPGSGTPFIVWSCGRVWNPSTGGTCDSSGVDHIHIVDLNNGNMWTAPNDWTVFKPSATFFNNMLWVAWCGNYDCSGTLNVASIYPAQLTGCTYSLQTTYYIPGSGGPYADSVSTTGNDCVWSANPNSSWLTIAKGEYGTGNGTFEFAAAENSGTPVTGTITAVNDQTVTVNQGTVGGTPGTGSVTIYGSPIEQTVNECPGEPHTCMVTMWESGTVSVTVNGQAFTTSYGGSSWTPAGLASSLASQINSQPPYSAVSATASGSTVTIKSTINGANTNYSLSTSYTYATGFSGPAAYAVASGSSLTGGTN